MTYCIGMRSKDGLVGIADTRITSGKEAITAKKVTIYHGEKSAMFLMTSGLRSVRDKALTYFEEILEMQDPPFSRLHQAVDTFGQQLRKVAQTDKDALEAAGLHFDLYTLIGGQMSDDAEPKLFLLYPQGNWVEVSRGTPFQIVGSGGYGKPVLDRTYTFQDSLSFALKVGFLSFDSTRISDVSVDYPVDVVLYEADSYRMVEQRYTHEDLKEISNWWMDHLKGSIHELPSEWIDALKQKLHEPEGIVRPRQGPVKP